MALTAPIINLYKSLDEAMYFRNSWLNQKFDFSGVQLLPLNPNKYIQVTNTTGGINLEDWVVKVFSLCGSELGDITPSFMVESLTNSDNGNPQFIWSLTNIPQDFGWGLIYLQILQSSGELFYTNPFKITAIDEEKTAFIAYKYKKTEPFQTIQFTTWYREQGLPQEITGYYQESAKSTVTSQIKFDRVEKWSTENMNRDLLIELKYILALPYVYIDFIRSNYYEASDLEWSSGRQNFASMDYFLVRHNNDRYEEKQESNGDFASVDWLTDDFYIYT
jgi:hypothetical protein